LSCNIALPWSPEFIGRFSALLDLRLVAYLLAQPWNAKTMALYGHTPDSLAAAHETARVLDDGSKHDETQMLILQALLSMDERLVWTEEFIKDRGEDLCEPALMENPALPWSKSFLYRSADDWDWYGIGACEHIPWDPELVLYTVKRIEAHWPDGDDIYYNLSRNPGVWAAVKDWASLSPEMLE
jgi:hypothetical protein